MALSYEVSTGSGSDRVIVPAISTAVHWDPVATAPGTDLVMGTGGSSANACRLPLNQHPANPAPYPSVRIPSTNATDPSRRFIPGRAD